MKNVLFVMKLHEAEKEQLLRIPGYRFTFAESWDIPQEMFDQTEIIIGNPSKDVLSRFPNAEWLQLISAGADTYKDIDQKIMLTNAYNVFGEAISEYMLACAFSEV